MSRIREYGLAGAVLLLGCAVGFGTAEWQANSSLNAAARARSPGLAEQARPGSPTRQLFAGNNGESVFASLLTAIHNSDGHFRGRIELCRLVEQIDSTQIPDLLARAEKVPLKYRRELNAALLERWLEVDPGGAMQWLRPHSQHSDDIASIWAQVAPPEDLRAILTNPTVPGRYWNAPLAALNKLAGGDPQAQVAALASLPPGVTRNHFLNYAFSSWAEKDPSAAFQAAQSGLSGPDREGMEKEILYSWAKLDPAAAIKKVTEAFPSPKPGLFGDQFITLFTQTIAEKDPSAAMNFAFGLDESLRAYPIVAATAAWAKTDPAAALAWSYENGVDIGSLSSLKYFPVHTVLSEALESQPEATIQWLLTLPPEAGRDQILAEAYTQQVGNLSPDKLLARTGTPLDDLYDNLSPYNQRRLASDIGARVVVDGTFPDFTAWTVRFGEGPARATAITGAVTKIFENIPAKADSVIAGLPLGPDRDQAIAGVAGIQKYEDPIGAAQHALLIGDDDARHDTLDDVISLWIKKDEGACRAWLAAAKGVPAGWTADWLKQKSSAN